MDSMNADSFQTPQTVSLKGRRFAGVSNSPEGEVDSATVFSYYEEDEMVWADYAGGTVRRHTESAPAPRKCSRGRS